jgi:hypothetical protein
MLQITTEFQDKVVEALLEKRQYFTGTDEKYAKQYDINKSVYSRIKNGERGNLIKTDQWLTIGRQLNVNLNKRQMKITRNDVINQIEEEVDFCQTHSKAMIFADDSEIGKTTAAKYLCRTRTNCFYVDGSQSRSARLLVRAIAKSVGIDSTGKYDDVKENTKLYLNILPNPCVIIDDAGLLKMEAFMELHEMWNSTEDNAGWYMIGDESLVYLIEKGIRSKKPGIRAFFNRYSSNYSRCTPTNTREKVLFYQKLLTDVLSANVTDKSTVNNLVTRCLRSSESGHVSGLRRADSIMILNS